MLADLLTSRVMLSLGGKQWRVVFTHRCLLECEDVTGVELLSSGLGVLPPSLLRALVFVALRRAGAGWSIEEIGKHLRPKSLPATHRAIREAWIASMPTPEGGEASGEPVKFTWLEAWAIADQMGLSGNEWLDMTPRMLQALRKQRLVEMQRAEILTGIIASTVANFGMCRPEKALKPEDFMLHPFEHTAGHQQTGDDVMKMFGSLPKGAVTRK